MSDEAPKKQQSAGAPAWVMTFADLMSLLMCFFVLLLSFSEMDVAKYKQIAGSMKMAFGVQRKHEVKEAPKGINVIAQEFSAGRPDPTPLNVMEQMTTETMKMFLDTGDKRRKSGDGGKKSSGDAPGSDANSANADQSGGANKGKDDSKDGGKPGDSADDQLVMMPKEDALRALKAKEAEERQQRLEQTAKRIRSALRWEIKDGAVDVETEEQKIVIRVREKASFPSGNANLREGFRPILQRVGKILKETEGHIMVSGHTDNVPIYTDRFRSNWELSSSRAVSVVHELIDAAGIPSSRFAIEGLADTRPIVPNSSAENRAKNRRVEIKLIQGDDLEAAGQLSGEPATAPQQAPPKIPAPAKPKPTPAKGDPFVRGAG